MYRFSSIKTGECADFFYSMKDAPKMGTIIDVEGQKWKRVFDAPQLACAGLKPIDPNNAKQFVDKTGSMKGTVGDMWALSAELSEKRAAKIGKDPIKETFYKNYRRARRGTPHMKQLAEQQAAATVAANEKMKKAGISISLT